MATKVGMYLPTRESITETLLYSQKDSSNASRSQESLLLSPHKNQTAKEPRGHLILHLVLGSKESKPKIKLSIHFKPNLTTLFARQKLSCWKLQLTISALKRKTIRTPSVPILLISRAHIMEV